MTPITIKLPTGVALSQGIVYESKTPTNCPRCGSVATMLMCFVRRVDGGRATLHCGCMTEAERNGAIAPQTFASEEVRILAEKHVQSVINSRG